MLLVFAHYLCLLGGLVLNDNTYLHNTNRRIGPNDVNDESIDTFSEVGYLYDGLYEGLISEMVKEDRKREKGNRRCGSFRGIRKQVFFRCSTLLTVSVMRKSIMEMFRWLTTTKKNEKKTTLTRSTRARKKKRRLLSDLHSVQGLTYYSSSEITETMSKRSPRSVGREMLTTGIKKMTEIANKARVIEQAKNFPRRNRDAMVQRKDMRNEGETKKDIFLNVLKVQWDIDTISEKYRDLEKQYKNEIEKLQVLGRLEIYHMDEIEYHLSQSEVNWQMNLRNFQEESEERASDRNRAKREIEELRREVEEEDEQKKEEKLSKDQRLEVFGKVILGKLIKIEKKIKFLFQEKERRQRVRAEARSINNRPERLLFRLF
ncbi:hypothetical protein CRE_14793 [Caenorhabditis remanei]|uniref:Uncharacterized protein n=1 Tax=Caenorhabditis remanei TaxID=31234 RepID=E3MRR6_CAERE|nr:hypothetical protein CRE_14793 [Caenorhabditis remanei]